MGLVQDGGVKQECLFEGYGGRSSKDLAWLLSDYERSGLTQREYALQAGMGYSTLTLRLRQARQLASASSPPSQVSFIPVKAPVLPLAPADLYELRWPGGFSLHLGRGFDPEEVRQLLSLLPPCSP